MKPTIIKLTSHKTSRAIALVLSFVVVAWFGVDRGSAQGKKARRVVSMKATDSREGAKVTLLADLALNDYEAFRRGDRFSVKIPASEFASSQPNFRGNGFEDVQVQRSGANVVISFKLQPGATARVDQRANRLDVVFTSSAKQTSNQSNAPGSSQNVGSASGQNRDRRTGDSAGAFPPNSPGSVRSASNQTTSRGGQSASQPTEQTSQSRESDAKKKPEYASAIAASPQADTSQSRSATSPDAFATPAPTIDPAPGSAYQPQNENSAGTAKSVPSQSPSSTTNSQRWHWAQQWWRLNWQLGTALALLILGVPLVLAVLLFKRRRARAIDKWQPVKRWTGEKVGPSVKRVVADPVGRSAESILDEIVSVDPKAPRVAAETANAASKEPEVETANTSASETRVARSIRAAATEQKEDFEQPLEEPIVSQLPEVKESAVEPPFSNPPAQFERADFEVKKLLSGKEFDVNLIDAADIPSRQIVGASLVAALTSGDFEQHHHARKAFVDYGYFDETTRELRTADSPAERSAAARKLGVVGDSRGTAHLIGALFDTAPEVRRSSVESLGQIGDAAALQSLNDLLQRETSRQLPEAVIRHAINSITVSEVKRTLPVEKSSLRVVDPYRQESKEEFTRLIDELQQEESLSEGIALLSSQVTPVAAPAAAQSFMSSEEVKLQLEEDSLRKAAADPEGRRVEAEPTRQRADEDARLEAEESEAQTRAEIEARMRAEEEARKLAEQEALRRQIEEEAPFKAEHENQLKAEQEARLRIEGEAQFRMEAETLRRAAEELARKRVEADAGRRLPEEHTRKQMEAETRQRAEEEAKHQAEEQLRREVELEMQRRVEEQTRQVAAADVRKRLEDEVRQQIEAEAHQRAEEEARRRANLETTQHRAQAHSLFEADARIVEQDPLRLPPNDAFLVQAVERRRLEEERSQEEHEGLLRAADDVARRRREVEQSRIRAEQEARFLGEAQERINIEEENRRQVTEERQRLEIEARRCAEEERQRFEEARHRTIEDQKRREEEARRKAEEESKLLAESQERIRDEEEVRQLAELQRQRLEQEARIRAEQERRRLEEAQQRALLEQQQLVDAARLKAEEQVRLVVAVQQRIQAEEEARKQA